MVTLTLAKGCASTAWVFAILDSDNIAICSFPEETQEEIWGANPAATLAGNTNLNPAAEVERIPGGYRLSGTWGYCSGSDFSEWLIFNAPVGEEREGHMFIVAGDEAETIDDWWPTGMRGTGSRSKRVTRVFVPDRRVMRTADTTIRLEERRSLHPTFDATYAPWPSHGRFPFAATAVGAAVGAAEDFAESSGSLTRVAHASAARPGSSSRTTSPPSSPRRRASSTWPGTSSRATAGRRRRMRGATSFRTNGCWRSSTATTRS
jgi:resorcinol 4-hydroxylase (FADH2)